MDPANPLPPGPKLPSLSVNVTRESDHATIVYPRAGGPGNVTITVPPGEYPPDIAPLVAKIDRIMMAMASCKLRLLEAARKVADEENRQQT